MSCRWTKNRMLPRIRRLGCAAALHPSREAPHVAFLRAIFVQNPTHRASSRASSARSPIQPNRTGRSLPLIRKKRRTPPQKRSRRSTAVCELQSVSQAAQPRCFCWPCSSQRLPFRLSSILKPKSFWLLAIMTAQSQHLRHWAITRILPI